MNAIIQSLFGVPYIWPEGPARPPSYASVKPAHARTYGENQALGKYIPWWWGSWLGGEHEAYWASDEPGIGDLILLCKGPQSNAFVIPAINTWGVTNDNITGYNLPKKIYTNTTSLIEYQIIGDPAAHLRALALVGAKNHTINPFGTDGTNFWAVDGNEYLPASMCIRYAATSSPITNINTFFQTDCISSCLTILDTNNTPQFQYGLFDRTFNSSPYCPSAPNALYFSIEGTNLAGFYTPEAERGFAIPVNSSTVNNLLCGINEREVVAGVEQTPWQAEMTEWIDVPTNSNDVSLNFFPVEWDWVEMADAFTHVVFTNWTYTVTNKTITLTDPPSCLQVNYIGYLGGKDAFTNAYDNESVVIPALTTNALAGIPITTGLVSQVQAAATNLISHYLDRTRLTNGTFNGYFAANTNATAFPALTVTGLLARLNLTTNGFDWTPWNPLGTSGIHDLLTNMTLTSRLQNGWYTFSNVSNCFFSGYAVSTNSESEAKTMALSNVVATDYRPTDIPFAKVGWGATVPPPPLPQTTNWTAWIYSTFQIITVSNLPTSLSASIDFYNPAEKIFEDIDWDAGATGFVESDYYRTQKTNVTYDASGVLSLMIGYTNVFPNWRTNLGAEVGYIIGKNSGAVNPLLLFDWGVTNGFKYR